MRYGSPDLSGGNLGSMRPATGDGVDGRWTILTGHGHVLVEITRNPEARVRDISLAAGITERTAHAIIADLERAGYLTRSRSGRRTHYSVNLDAPFRHSSQDGYSVGPFLRLLTAPLEDAAKSEDGAEADAEDEWDSEFEDEEAS